MKYKRYDVSNDKKKIFLINEILINFFYQAD